LRRAARGGKGLIFWRFFQLLHCVLLAHPERGEYPAGDKNRNAGGAFAGLPFLPALSEAKQKK
jgi:hypothetical protein